MIVIAVLATLAGVVVVVLNPAELLAKARDSKRIDDLAKINKALSLYQADGRGSFGQANIVYISLPDTNSNCSSHSLPPLPSGWSYRCVTQDNLRKTNGDGWIPVNLQLISFGQTLASLPVDPINDDTYYYTYISGGSWALSALAESVSYKEKANQTGFLSTRFEYGTNLSLNIIPFAGDWIRVPGNPLYNTSDFWVMKYEAKCVDASGASLTSPNTGYDTYSNSGAPCTTVNNRYLASIQEGFPIANITHNQAKDYCASIGAHLITNQEWMTIARNIEQISANWTTGTIGSGSLFRGHTDNVPSKALVAGNDNDGYFGTGNSFPSEQARTFKLSNGEVIWDLAGNVWEHVMKDSSDTLVRYTPSDGGAIGWKWIEHTAVVNYGDFSYNEIRPSNEAWNATQGMGRIYTYNGDYGSQTRVLLRGGSWYNGSNAGAFTLYLLWDTTNQYCTVGFRCAR